MENVLTFNSIHAHLVPATYTDTDINETTSSQAHMVCTSSGSNGVADIKPGVFIPLSGWFTAESFPHFVSEAAKISGVRLTLAKGFVLTGLHACGDLTSTAIRTFLATPDIKGLCLVGCCYNLLSERWDCNKLLENDPFNCGFPLSAVLNKLKFVIGAPGRTLACQSLEGWCQKPLFSSPLLFYRAILEQLVCEMGISLPNPKGVRKAASFHDYVRKVGICSGLGNESISDEIIDVYWSKYGHLARRHAIFLRLRFVISLCLESLVVLDRACSIYEEVGVYGTYGAIFDAHISPRTFALRAWKR